MSDLQGQKPEPTALDDVRAVRGKIARQHGGDLKAHAEETNRIGAAWRAKHNIQRVPLPKKGQKRETTNE